MGIFSQEFDPGLAPGFFYAHFSRSVARLGALPRYWNDPLSLAWESFPPLISGSAMAVAGLYYRRIGFDADAATDASGQRGV
ncbi:hypothetical protein [Cupriavidus sp. SW-Y-13]|uniref:hypothetical protein n=1 Tax=Cupriavidus sp. SW-Y-13 TaxID=2653854 RepID=UPI00136580BC|nr:hypothetical protein [Cupriavidus sp. SW-Y-13]MWL86092.1 hypothetical protein [Cupriavidus sp. SW-Y-13]